MPSHKEIRLIRALWNATNFHVLFSFFATRVWMELRLFAGLLFPFWRTGARHVQDSGAARRKLDTSDILVGQTGTFQDASILNRSLLGSF